MLSSDTSAERSKRQRWRVDDDVRRVLEEEYKKNKFPSSEERQALADRLQVAPRRVQVWFQNHRQRELPIERGKKRPPECFKNDTGEEKHFIDSLLFIPDVQTTPETATVIDDFLAIPTVETTPTTASLADDCFAITNVEATPSTQSLDEETLYTPLDFQQPLDSQQFSAMPDMNSLQISDATFLLCEVERLQAATRAVNPPWNDPIFAWLMTHPPPLYDPFMMQLWMSLCTSQLMTGSTASQM